MRAAMIDMRCMLQLVTTIPTSKLPKSWTTGRMTSEEVELMERRDSEPADPLATDDMGRRGQILWIRGLTRLQHQVSRSLALPVAVAGSVTAAASLLPADTVAACHVRVTSCFST